MAMAASTSTTVSTRIGAGNGGESTTTTHERGHHDDDKKDEIKVKTRIGDGGIGGVSDSTTSLPPTRFNRLLSLLPIKDFSNLTNRVLITNLVPDRVLRQPIRWLLWDRLREYSAKTTEQQMEYKQAFIRQLKSMPIAMVTDKANEQHYEVPSEFYLLVLGRHLKYSSCLYETSTSTLDEAERAMLELYCVRAELTDGMSILDLGCGWGSFSLFAAAKYPNSRITAVSNSRTQREFIEGKAKERGITNLRVITCDANKLTPDVLGIIPATATSSSSSGDGKDAKSGSTMVGGFDRIISIEMMEHMKNYERLFEKVAACLKPDTGRLFVHIFTNTFPYHFEGDNWMARYFFSGGTMPSDDLFIYFQRDLQVMNHWRVNGKHYARTSRHWLNRMDANETAIRKIFADTYGGAAESKRWWVMWRTFFIAVEECFGYNNGNDWMVSHYLFSRPSRVVTTSA